MGLTLEPRLCDLCLHRHGDTHPPTCDAFPKRIPLEIRVMYVDHRQPYPGDSGITFEPANHSPETLAEIAKVKMRVRPRLPPLED